MKVSAVWITKNESEKLKRSMQSVQAIADEMVVVDTGSSDGTAEMAKAIGARVEHFEWVNDFAAARNFALAQVNGDVIVMPDSDEWFVPALGPQHRELLETRFLPSAGHVLASALQDFDKDTGVDLGIISVTRIFRGKAGLQFKGAIHEKLVLPDGKQVVKIEPGGFDLWHDGYSSEVRVQKTQRNLALLEQEADTLADPMDKLQNLFYLLRESYVVYQYDKSMVVLQKFLSAPRDTENLMKNSPFMGLTLVYFGLLLGAEFRNHISRSQLERVLVQNMEKLYPDYPGRHMVRLFYETLYDNNEERLLAQVDDCYLRAEALVQEGKHLELDEYRRMAADVLIKAGRAAWRRGEKERAFDYASRAIRQSEVNVPADALTLLLRCTKGLPEADVILFLNSTLAVEKPGILEVLLGCLKVEGYADLYTYYMKKMLDAGKAKKADFWYLMIVLGKAKEAAQAAFEAREETDDVLVRQMLFFAAVCAQDEALYREYKDAMGEYAPVAEAFFAGEARDGLHGNIMDNYRQIAFAGGRDVANRYAALYTDKQTAAFLAQADYYMAAGLYTEWIEETAGREAGTLAELLLLAEAHIMTGGYGRALELLENSYERFRLNDDFFNLCDIIAQKADSAVAKRAQALYQNLHGDYQAWVELCDMLFIAEQGLQENRKKKREYEQMRPEQLEKRLAPKPYRPFADQVAGLSSAATYLRRQNVLTKAADCYITMLQLQPDTDEWYTALGETLEELGNHALALYVQEKAEKLR